MYVFPSCVKVQARTRRIYATMDCTYFKLCEWKVWNVRVIKIRSSGFEKE